MRSYFKRYINANIIHFRSFSANSDITNGFYALDLPLVNTWFIFALTKFLTKMHSPVPLPLHPKIAAILLTLSRGLIFRRNDWTKPINPQTRLHHNNHPSARSMDLANSVARGDENRRHEGSTFKELVRSTSAFARDELLLDETGE